MAMTTVTGYRNDLRQVVKEAVDDYLRGIQGKHGGFDRHQVELRVLGTPEYRRIHDIQIEHFDEIDIEEPLRQWMGQQVHAYLRQHKDSEGNRDILAVPASGDGGRHVWIPRDNVTFPMFLKFAAQWEKRARLAREMNAINAKLIGVWKERGLNCTLGAIYGDVLSESEKLTFGHRFAGMEVNGDEEDS